MSIVRLALVTSMRCWPPSGPPVSHQSSHVSIVPKIACPASASSRTPSTFARTQAILPPAKYAAGGSPERWRIRSPCSSSASAAISAVRVSCHTIAFV